MADQPVAPATPDALNVNGQGLKRIAVAFLPFTAVPFSGPDAVLAWARLGAYSLLAYWAFNRMRPASYICMSAAGVSLATSLASGLWSKQNA